MQLRVLLAVAICLQTVATAQAQDAAQRCAVTADPQARVDACREALREDSLDAYSQYNLGVAFYQLNDPDSAFVHLRTSAAIRPAYASPHAMLANLDIDRHHVDDALAEADSAIQADSKNALGYKAKARLLLAQNRFADALPLTRQAVALAPDDPWAHANRAEALGGTHQLSAALTEARQALALDGPHGYVYALLGRIFLAQRHPEHALAATDTALAADSMVLGAYLVRVQALLALHRPEEAAAVRARLLQRFPTAGAIVTGMSMDGIVSHTNATNVVTILTPLDSGDNLTVRAAHANALFRAGRKNDAILIMRDFVRHHADDAHGWLFLGYVEGVSLHYANALADWKTAVALDSTILDGQPQYRRMRTELSQVVAEPKAATVADLDAPIPPDPPPPPASPRKHVVVHGIPLVTVPAHETPSPAKPTKP